MFFEVKDEYYYHHVAVKEAFQSLRHDYKRMLAELEVLAIRVAARERKESDMTQEKVEPTFIVTREDNCIWIEDLRVGRQTGKPDIKHVVPEQAEELWQALARVLTPHTMDFSRRPGQQRHNKVH